MWKECLVATYRYRCDVHGPFDVSRPIGTAPGAAACPRGDGASPRVFTAPMLGLAPRAAVALIDRTAATADPPRVVSSPPRRPAHRATPLAPPDPALRRLPRP